MPASAVGRPPDRSAGHHGKHYTVPASRIGLTPTRTPRPPLYFAAYSEGAMLRTARFADGWTPAGVPFDAMTAMWGGIRAMAEDFGRDADALELVVRGTVMTSEHCAADRPMFSGSAAQIADDIVRSHELGAAEVIIEAQFCEAAADLNRYLDLLGDVTQRCVDLVAEPDRRAAFAGV